MILTLRSLLRISVKSTALCLLLLPYGCLSLFRGVDWRTNVVILTLRSPKSLLETSVEPYADPPISMPQFIQGEEMSDVVFLTLIEVTQVIVRDLFEAICSVCFSLPSVCFSLYRGWGGEGEGVVTLTMRSLLRTSVMLPALNLLHQYALGCKWEEEGRGGEGRGGGGEGRGRV